MDAGRKVGVGSIPAHAGEPVRSAHVDVGLRVYPRPRGGTEDGISPSDSILGLSPPTRGNPAYRLLVGVRPGLSPPTRGNQLLPAVDVGPSGSIPAHAGEPRMRRQRRGYQSVYPRPRGGTHFGDDARKATYGLSPPTRGNRLVILVSVPCDGSIPAHAGEPTWRGCCGRSRTVYPRPRGGTVRARPVLRLERGLSPPTRGNQLSTERG